MLVIQNVYNCSRDFPSESQQVYLGLTSTLKVVITFELVRFSMSTFYYARQVLFQTLHRKLKEGKTRQEVIVNFCLSIHIIIYSFFQLKRTN